MFKIDKSSVDYMDINMSILMVQDENRDDQKDGSSHHETPDEQSKMSEELSNEIIQQAQAQAQDILNEAQEQSQMLQKAAWQQGYKDGMEESRRISEALRKQEDKLSKAIFSRLDEFEKSINDELEEDILQLSVDIAKKIVNYEIKINDSLFIGIIKNAVSRIHEDRKILLRVSSEDYDRFFANREQTVKDDWGYPGLTITRDDFMESGNCVLEFDNGIMDLGIDSQLNVIERALRQDRKAM